MVSPSKNQVKIGKIINPADEPMNLAVQADPVSSIINFQEYQKAMEQGTPRVNAAVMGRSSHHSEIYWELSWNHPMICPKKTRAIPNDIFINALPNLVTQFSRTFSIQTRTADTSTRSLCLLPKDAWNHRHHQQS